MSEPKHGVHIKTHNTAKLLIAFALNGFIMGTYKVRNEIETKRNETKRNQRKRNETKRNETKSTKTKRNEINENETKRNQRNGNEMKRNQRNRLI